MNRRLVALRTAFSIQHSAFPASRPALTLIELLVSIVILVTVLAGVIPVLSPNNDARRIRSAAKQLQSMLAQAQALATREGRPYGVAFREAQVEVDDTTDPVTRLTGGVGLEAYFISEPKPFSGFSQFSRARLLYPENGGWLRAQFVLAGTPSGANFPDEITADELPPGMIRRGDRILIDRREYRITDLDQDGDGQPEDPVDFREGDYYTLDQGNPPKSTFLIDPIGGPPTLSRNVDGEIGGEDVYATNPKPYKFLRQASNPSTRPGNTAGPPLQFPRGVGIDVLASGVDFRIPSSATDVPKFLQFGFTSLQSRHLALLEGIDLNDPTQRPWPVFEPPITVGVMFAATGDLHAIWVNGENLEEDFWVRPDRLYLLVGRAENSARTLEEIGGDGTAGSKGLADFSDLDPIPAAGEEDLAAEDVATRREQLNWLNGDSLWVTVAARSGRIVTSPNNAATDPRVFAGSDVDVPEQIARQLQAARTFARGLESVGGGQ